jgi:hypothetical protein
VTEYQEDLFGSVDLLEPKATTEEQFAQFCRRNPWFLKRVAELTYEFRLRGAQRVSMKRVFEELRGDVEDQGTTYRLNNDWSALASRRIVELYPDLDGAYAMRARRS